MIPLTQPSSILLVDDDPVVLMLFSAALTRDGCEVRTAATGQEALAAQREKPADVAVLDIVLPDISGTEVMQQIVQTSTTRVILITGGEGRYSYTRAMQEGALDFLLKPIRLAELGQRIQQALQQR